MPEVREEGQPTRGGEPCVSVRYGYAVVGDLVLLLTVAPGPTLPRWASAGRSADRVKQPCPTACERDRHSPITPRPSMRDQREVDAVNASNRRIIAIE
jgi:hypothetical protein